MATRMVCYDDRLDTILRHPRFKENQEAWYTCWGGTLKKGTVIEVSMYKNITGVFVAYTYKVKLTDGTIVDSGNTQHTMHLDRTLLEAKYRVIRDLVDDIDSSIQELDQKRKKLSAVMQLTEADFQPTIKE